MYDFCTEDCSSERAKNNHDGWVERTGLRLDRDGMVLILCRNFQVGNGDCYLMREAVVEVRVCVSEKGFIWGDSHLEGTSGRQQLLDGAQLGGGHHLHGLGDLHNRSHRAHAQLN